MAGTPAAGGGSTLTMPARVGRDPWPHPPRAKVMPESLMKAGFGAGHKRGELLELERLQQTAALRRVIFPFRIAWVAPGAVGWETPRAAWHHLFCPSLPTGP